MPQGYPIAARRGMSGILVPAHMSAKKNCAACGKQIPDVAVVCVFCSAKQPSPEDAEAAAPAVAAATAAVTHHTDPTLVGIKASDVEAELAKGDAPAAEVKVNGASATTMAQLQEAAAPAAAPAAAGEIPEPTVEAPAPTTKRMPMIEVEPWGGLGRLIMGIGGGVLIALFFCPWHGV